jgi:hypothetical protein
MNPWSFSYPTLAVSAIYCIWKAYLRAQWNLEWITGDRVTDADLARVVETWPLLREPIRRAVLALIAAGVCRGDPASWEGRYQQADADMQQGG